MRQSRFYTTIRKYLSGSLSQTEKAAFEKWLDNVVPQAEEDKTTWSESQQQALWNKIRYSSKNPLQPMVHTNSKKKFHWPAILAVSVTIGLATFAILTYTVKPSFYLAQSVPRETHKMILTDGTIVWLKADATLSYNENTTRNQRQAILTGQALFEVAKDPSRPFIVQCGNTSVKVLGTSFSLSAVNDSLNLHVLTGSVTVFSSEDKTGIQVMPHEMVRYAGKGIITKQKMNPSHVPAFVSATEYDMQFNDATFQQVVDKLQRKFNVTIKLNNNQIKNCHITANFTDHSLDRTLAMITEILGITYTREGNTVTITGKGCG